MQSDPLFILIKSLSKSEKRNFKLYVNRIQSKEEAKFIQLFDVLDKQKRYQEEVIFQKIPSLKKSQLSNLKRHLYRQILTSLRLIHIQKNLESQIREQIDFASILYDKGLYLQSLKLLDRVKNIAKTAHQDLLLVEIIEFEKLIESRHVTKTIENRAEELSDDSEKRNKVNYNASKLSSLSLKMYGFFLKLGQVRTEEDAAMVKAFFRSHIQSIDSKGLSFFQKVHLYQSYVWYYYILQDFLYYYRYSQKWVDLFVDNPSMQLKDSVLYVRGRYHLLVAQFNLRNYTKFCIHLEALRAFNTLHGESFNKNTEVLVFLCLKTAELDKHIFEGSFTEGLKLLPDLERGIKDYGFHLDSHRIMIFHYKIACIHFGSGNIEASIDYLNKIIQLKVGHLRADIQCYARLLHLIAHYELQHFGLLEYLVKSVYRFLGKMEDLNLVQREILKFLRNALNLVDPYDQKLAFEELKEKINKIAQHPLEKRSFSYLDIISWLESKIENRPIQDIIQEKFNAKLVSEHKTF